MVTGQLRMENKINQNIEDNQISILMRQDGYSFLIEKITEETSSELIHVELQPNQTKTPENLLEIFKDKINQEWIEKNHIKKARVLYHHSLFSLVPTDYFEKSAASDYIKYNTKILPEDQLVSEKIDSCAAVITYIPYTNINNYIIDLLGSFHYKHQLEPILQINYLLDQERERVLVFIDRNILSITAFSGQKLKLANTFQFTTQEDLAYYVLFCIEQVGFNREEMILLLFGSIKEEDTAFKYLFNYIKHVDFLFSELNYSASEIEKKSFQLVFEENYAHSLRKI